MRKGGCVWAPEVLLPLLLLGQSLSSPRHTLTQVNLKAEGVPLVLQFSFCPDCLASISPSFSCSSVERFSMSSPRLYVACLTPPQ